MSGDATPAPRVAVVTDSTCYLPVDLVREAGVHVVPLRVSLGQRSGAEGVDIRPQDVVDALSSGRRVAVTTSRPARPAFDDAFAAAAAAGATAVVCVHLSGRLSGTVQEAQVAGRDAPLPVRVVDSRSTGMGLGFAVLAAARAARAGATAGDVARVAATVASGASVLFSVATLEFLRRGGRIGPAAALLGSALRMRPVLELVEGQVVPVEKVRTTARARERLVEIAVSRAGERSCDLAVHHMGAPEVAAGLAATLQAKLAGTADVPVCEVGAVLGAHCGPGLIGVVVAPRVRPPAAPAA